MSGKSTLVKNLCLEDLQFEANLEQLIYVHSQEDENIKAIRKKWGKKVKFLNEIPLDLPEQMIPGKSVVVLDDVEETLVHDKERTKMLKAMANIYIHHYQLIMILCLQSYDLFYKRHPLNGLLQQATKLILFKSINNFSSLKRWLNSYGIKLKADQQLFDVFKSLVSETRYNYLVIDLDQSLNSAQVYTHVLYADPRPFLVFHVESE